MRPTSGPAALLGLLSLAWIVQLVSAGNTPNTSLGPSEARQPMRDLHVRHKYRLVKAHRLARSGQTIPSSPLDGDDLAERDAAMAPGQPFFASEPVGLRSETSVLGVSPTRQAGTARTETTGATSTVIRVSSRISRSSDSAASRASSTVPTAFQSRSSTSTTPSDSASEAVAPPTSTSSSAESNSTSASAPSSTRILLTTMPGRTLAVFPIGLVVFGSLNGLLILVTLYMLWERRGYARQFEERKRHEKERRQGSEDSSAVAVQ